MKQVNVGFMGMTHLGIHYAVATAERNFNVIAFDTNSDRVNALRQQKVSINEPGLVDLLVKHKDRLQFTDDIQSLSMCDIIYIAEDVSTNDKGQSDLQPIRQLIDYVIQELSAQPILVILCQVPPGFTRAIPYPKERLYYQVETLIFGQAVERALYPERFIIGCQHSNAVLPSVYKTLLEAFQCPLLIMRYESAELAKIAINCCLVASISIANTLSEICENIKADWFDIMPALQLDKRIGPFAYLAPGLGIAGGNLERDLNTVMELSHQYGTDAGMIKACLNNSEYRRQWVLRCLHNHALNKKPQSNITLLGLTYKANTHSIKNSPALALLQALRGYTVRVYDPVISDSMTPHAQTVSSLDEAIQDADVLVIMTPWQDFKPLNAARLSAKMSGRLVIDPYRLLDSADLKTAGFTYLTLGVSERC